MKLIDFIPPIFINVLHKLTEKEQRVEYDNYLDALKECKNDGYEDIELCEVVAEKTKNYIAKLNEKPYIVNPTNVFFLSVINKFLLDYSINHINILDFGGACGAHYFEFRRFLDKKIKLNWIVVETNQMVASAKKFKLDNEELKFYNSLNDVNTDIDIIHSSGTLQYIPQPYDFLEKLLNFNAKWIFFNRMIFNENNRDTIVIQRSLLSHNGPGPLPEKYNDRIVLYPHTTISYNKFIEKIAFKYKLEWMFEENSGVIKISDNNQDKIIVRGLFFIKK